MQLVQEDTLLGIMLSVFAINIATKKHVHASSRAARQQLWFQNSLLYQVQPNQNACNLKPHSDSMQWTFSLI
jgi:hypothetical protein